MFERIKKAAFCQGYTIGYKVGKVDGEANVLGEKLAAYNRGYNDGINSETKKVLDEINSLKKGKKNVRKK